MQMITAFKDNWKTLGGTLIIGSVGLFIWEHAARKNNCNIKPSVGIEHLANYLSKFFNFCGRWTAKISSFYTYIDLKDIYKTASDLMKPTWNCILAIGEFTKGYYEVAVKYAYPLVYILGTTTLLAVISYTGYLYFINKVPISSLPSSFFFGIKNLILSKKN